MYPYKPIYIYMCFTQLCLGVWIKFKKKLKIIKFHQLSYISFPGPSPWKLLKCTFSIMRLAELPTIFQCFFMSSLPKKTSPHPATPIWPSAEIPSNVIPSIWEGTLHEIHLEFFMSSPWKWVMLVGYEWLGSKGYEFKSQPLDDIYVRHDVMIWSLLHNMKV